MIRELSAAKLQTEADCGRVSGRQPRSQRSPDTKRQGGRSRFAESGGRHNHKTRHSLRSRDTSLVPAQVRRHRRGRTGIQDRLGGARERSRECSPLSAACESITFLCFTAGRGHRDSNTIASNDFHAYYNRKILN